MTRSQHVAGAPDLTRLLSPRSVAVIGGTSKATGLGRRTLNHLEDAGFPGTVMTPEVGVPLSEDVDVALLGVPAAHTQRALDAIDGQAAFAVVYSSGFEEVAGTPLTTSKGTVIVGPNTVGLYHAPDRALLTFAQAFDSLTDCRHGSGAFLVSQSGAFGARLVTAAARYGFHLDGFIGSGNEAQLDACALARGVLAARPPRVLMLYLEGLRDTASLVTLLAEARDADVPVVCLLGGLSDAGADAAASHTAAVSADSDVTRELFHAYGAQLVDSDRELTLAALGLSAMGRAKGRRIGIVTGSGGAGVVAADILSGQGLEVATLSEHTRTQLAAHLPAIASTRNPVDVTAQVIGNNETLEKVCSVLRDSGEIDALLVVGREDQAVATGAVNGAALPTVVATLDRDASNIRPRIEAGELVLPDLDAACRVIAATAARPSSRSYHDESGPVDQSVRLTHDPSASESLTLVADAGVPVAPWRLATDAQSAAEAGAALGWPVVLKIDAAADVHKASAGGVRLDVRSETVDDAAAAMLMAGGALIVACQLRASLELFAGVRRDSHWGWVVSAGLGGGNIELMARTVAMPASLGPRHLATRLREELFDRAPGGRYDTVADELADIAHSLVALARRTDASLVECNPVGLVGDRLVALDARVVR